MLSQAKQLSDIITTIKNELSEMIPTELIDGVYSLAYDFYQKGKLDEAEEFFHFLCLYDFSNTDYIMGLAAVKQLQTHYQTAIDLYALAYMNSENDYRPVFYAGQCNVAIGELQRADYCFQSVIKHSDNKKIKQDALQHLNEIHKKSLDYIRK